MLSIAVPGEPVPWARPGWKGSRTFTTKDAAEGKANIRENAQLACRIVSHQARRDGIELIFPLAQPLLIAIVFHMGKPFHCDVDNLAKLVLDALNGVVYEDDRFVVLCSAVKTCLQPAKAKPQTTIAVFTGMLAEPPAAAVGAWIEANL